MSQVKIQIKVGDVEFSGEGEQGWVSTQLERVLKAGAAMGDAKRNDSSSSTRGHNDNQSTAAGSQTLASFLRDKNASTNQVKKFLATALWLHARGKKRLNTADVTRALKDSNQTRLGNPADCLNKNVAKGHCEKDGKDFFVTAEGEASL
jgi:hypothetical protein